MSYIVLFRVLHADDLLIWETQLKMMLAEGCSRIPSTNLRGLSIARFSLIVLGGLGAFRCIS